MFKLHICSLRRDCPLFQLIRGQSQLFFLTDEHWSKFDISFNSASDWLAVTLLASDLPSNKAFTMKNTVSSQKWVLSLKLVENITVHDELYCETTCLTISIALQRQKTKNTTGWLCISSKLPKMMKRIKFLPTTYKKKIFLNHEVSGYIMILKELTQT